jgi:hypothetical protein
VTATQAEGRDQTLRAGQFADRESMAGLFESGKVIDCPLLVRRVALDGVNHDYGIQVIQHSRPSGRGSAACGIQFFVTLDILGQAGLIFGTQVLRRTAKETA